MLERVLEAWRLSPGLHQFASPADQMTTASAEAMLGRPLPDTLKALYRFSDGMSALGGNLSLEPLLGPPDVGLVGLGDRLRAWNWPIPGELLMFGGNGGDDLFGLWYPPEASADAPSPVVMVGSVFEPASLALAGTELSRFLLAWSGFYLVLLDAPGKALDALGLPASLRRIDSDTTGVDADIAPFFVWADPDLGEPPNPYERGRDVAAIAELVRS